MTRAQAIERVKKDVVDDLVQEWGSVIATTKAQLDDPDTTFDFDLSHDDCVLMVTVLGELVAYIRAWEA
jgi:hypothetical protein